jgi:MFS family permease
MNEALGFSPKVFDLGAAFFTVGYVLLQVPGNLMLNRFGARRLIAAITLVWGIFGCLMATVWNEASFYVARMLLGAAESAFFPE